MTRIEFVEKLVSGWKSEIVARSKIAEFSGGAIQGRTVANRESQGSPVPGRVLVGKQVVYPVRELAEWIAKLYIREEAE